MVRLLCLYAVLFYLGTEFAIALQQARETPSNGTAALRDAAASARSDDRTPFLGVTVYLEQYDDPGLRREALARLSAAGFGWARQRMDWSRIEPEPGAFQWAWSDEVIDDIIDVGLAPVVVLDGSPSWAREERDLRGSGEEGVGEGGRSAAPPAATETFARFAAAFAERYRDSVRYYQIWDEPNIAPHWGSRRIDPVGYARLLKDAASAVRSADPDAVVLAAALAPTQDRGHTAVDEGYFLQRLYAAGAAPYFDAVLVQPFGFGTAASDPRSRVETLNFRRAAWVRRVMVAAGDSETPVWAVRFGWNRQVQERWRTVSAENQARFTEEAVRHARANWPWLAAMGWPVDAPAAAPDDPMWGFALFTPEGPEEPILSTLRETGTAANEAGSYTAATGVRTAQLVKLALLLAACGALLGAGFIELRRLPLARWKAGYLGLPAYAKAALWIAVAVSYHFSVWPPLVGLCWLAAAFLVAAEPRAGLMLALAALPFHFQHKELRLVGSVAAVPPAQAALLAMIPALAQRAASFCARAGAVGILSALRRSFARRAVGDLARKRPATDLLAATWVAAGLVSAFNVWHWAGFARGFWELTAVPVLLYGAIRLFAADEGPRRGLQAALFAGGLLAAAAGLWDWLAGGGVEVDGVRRLMGVSYSPNQSALYLLRTLFVGAGLLATSGQRRSALLAGCLTVAAALLLTLSRGALGLGLPAGAAAAAAAIRAREGVRRVGPALVLALLVGVGALTLLYGERLLNTATLQSRLSIWRDALRLWREYPLLGVGPGGFYWNYPAFMQPSATADPNLIHPHSLWLEYATGWGVVGLLWLGALGAWLIHQLRCGWRGAQTLPRAGLLAALFAGLGHAQMDAFAALPELAAWNFAALALLTRSGRAGRSSR